MGYGWPRKESCFHLSIWGHKTEKRNWYVCVSCIEKKCTVHLHLYYFDIQVDLLDFYLSSRPNLKCSFLLDYLRGSRGQPSSRTMVQHLLNKHQDRFKLHLYHTPNLRGVLKYLGPERFNEVMGLQHMKIYIFDNDLVLSG